MKALSNTLSEFASVPMKLGDTSKPPLEISDLQTELKNHRKQNNYVFFLIILLIVVLFAVGLILLLRYHENTSLLTAIFGACGVSLAGSIKLLSDTWKEKQKIDMIYALSDRLNEDALRSVVLAIVGHEK